MYLLIRSIFPSVEAIVVEIAAPSIPYFGIVSKQRIILIDNDTPINWINFFCFPSAKIALLIILLGVMVIIARESILNIYADSLYCAPNNILNAKSPKRKHPMTIGIVTIKEFFVNPANGIV